MIQLIVLLPLLAAAIAGLGNKALGKIPAKIVTTGALFAACAMSWPIFISFLTGHAEPYVAPVFTWIESGSFDAQWALRVDTMTAVMLVVITSVSSLVHLYSWGYMDEEPDQPRFFAYLSLFTFAMLMLVTANNLLQMFFGWEGVGLASYLLIGFWFRKPSANAAAIKAFVVNRVGDLGFMMGIFGTYLVFNTISIPEILEMAPSMAGSTIGFLGHRFDTMTVLCLLLFIGAMGKSAQFFLHTWLPDAMEGPTPVSALIHAATMVTAGVYMVCLLSPIYEYAPGASQIIAIIGAITALFAATVGLTQNDIKRVIAYSTCSQLGYMFFAAGVGAYQAAMFHLFTHAFFKALLFLGAGSVIHGMHHEQDMRKMGGLWKLLPVTYAVMTIGTIAITGLGIPGVGGFAGFYSKDSIIESAYASAASGHSAIGMFAFFVGIIAAGLTAYYSWRLVFMTFHNKPVWKEEEVHAHHADDHASHAQLETHSEPVADAHAHDDHAHDDHGHHGPLKPHESPWVMLVPLILLSVGAVAAGFVFAPHFIGHHEHEFWRGAIFVGEHNHVLHESHEVPTWVKWSPLILTLIGTAFAYWIYVAREGMGRRMAERNGVVYRFLYNKWYFDELYDFVFVRGFRAIGNFFWKICDVKIIDGLGPNGAAWASLKSAARLGKIQSGYVYHYAFVMLLGVAGLLTFAILAWGA